MTAAALRHIADAADEVEHGRAVVARAEQKLRKALADAGHLGGLLAPVLLDRGPTPWQAAPTQEDDAATPVVPLGSLLPTAQAALDWAEVPGSFPAPPAEAAEDHVDAASAEESVEQIVDAIDKLHIAAAQAPGPDLDSPITLNALAQLIGVSPPVVYDAERLGALPSKSLVRVPEMVRPKVIPRLARAYAAARFEKDISTHKLVEAHAHGLLRRLVSRGDRGRAYWFDVVTWPGALCIDGDMGSFVFRRLEDMFEFFRASENTWPTGWKEAPPINPDYWAEKLVSTEPRRGVKVYSPDAFAEAVNHRVDDFIADEQLPPKTSAALRAEVCAEVIAYANDGQDAATRAAMNFQSARWRRFNLNDFWEANCTEYSFHFLWCCHAIVWAIRQYDAARSEQDARSQAELLGETA